MARTLWIFEAVMWCVAVYGSAAHLKQENTWQALLVTAVVWWLAMYRVAAVDRPFPRRTPTGGRDADG